MFIYPKLPKNLTISGYITSKNTSLWNISNIFDKKNITVQCFCEMNCCYIYDMFLLNKDLYIFWKRQLQCCSQMTTGGRGEITIPSKRQHNVWISTQMFDAKFQHHNYMETKNICMAWFPYINLRGQDVLCGMYFLGAPTLNAYYPHRRLETTLYEV